MACEALISDWNGTLIRYRNELPVLESVAVHAFMNSIPFHPLRTLRILKARIKLRELHGKENPETDPDFLREMFRIFNQKVVSGVPVSVIHHSFDEYASSSQTQSKLDLRLLRVTKDLYQAGKITGILSAGYRYGIEKVLSIAGHRHYFSFCEADEFRVENGRVVEFMLNIYGNKPRHLLRLLAGHRLEAGKVAYIGDSEDDEGCFEIVGYPVVAFLAPDPFKNVCSRKYRAFVPESEEDLARFLRNA